MEFVFDLKEYQISNVIEKLYCVLKQIDIWRTSYRHSGSYRTILDCTEMFVVKADNPSTHQMTFSPYKDNPTFKLLVGYDEAGAVNFISDAVLYKIAHEQSPPPFIAFSGHSNIKIMVN